jgi:hypothetical protein
VRRAAARPRRSDQAAAGETLSRAGRGGLTAEPAWAVERRRRRPQEHGWASQRAVARRGGPGGPDAGRAFVTLSTSSASVRCPVSVSGASDQCPRLPVHGTAVQYPVRASERPGVRCPASGVYALPRPLCPAEVRSWSAAWAGSRMAGMAGVGVVARCVHDRLVVCPSRRLVLEAGAGAAGPAEASVWTWPSSGGGRAVASSTAWPIRIRRVHARMVRWWEPVRGEARLLRQADRHAAGESLGGSCRVEPNIKKPIGHVPLAKQD